MLEALLERFVPRDVLAAGTEAVVAAQLAPVITALRAEILKHVAGDPPPQWRERLNAAGLNVDDASAAFFWKLFFTAIAETPQLQATEEERAANS